MRLTYRQTYQALGRSREPPAQEICSHARAERNIGSLFGTTQSGSPPGPRAAIALHERQPVEIPP